MISIFVVAHVPLASALAACAQHVLGEDPDIQVFDVQPDECSGESAPMLCAAILASASEHGALILTDLPGATPSNIAIAASLLLAKQGIACRVLGGVNPSMLLKAINYRSAPLDVVMEKALTGATQAVLRVD